MLTFDIFFKQELSRRHTSRALLFYITLVACGATGLVLSLLWENVAPQNEITFVFLLSGTSFVLGFIPIYTIFNGINTLEQSHADLKSTVSFYFREKDAQPLANELAEECWRLFALESQYKNTMGPSIEDCVDEKTTQDWKKLREDIQEARREFRAHCKNCAFLGYEVRNQLKEYRPDFTINDQHPD